MPPYQQAIYKLCVEMLLHCCNRKLVNNEIVIVFECMKRIIALEQLEQQWQLKHNGIKLTGYRRQYNGKGNMNPIICHYADHNEGDLIDSVCVFFPGRLKKIMIK